MESVADYPRPPRLEPVSKRIQVVLGGITVADTTRAHRVLETTHPPTYYVPREDVLAERARGGRAARRPSASGRTAVYFDVVAGGVRAERAAWTYPHPTAGFEPIRDAVAFYCADGRVPRRRRAGRAGGEPVLRRLDHRGHPGLTGLGPEPDRVNRPIAARTIVEQPQS